MQTETIEQLRKDLARPHEHPFLEGAFYNKGGLLRMLERYPAQDHTIIINFINYVYGE